MSFDREAFHLCAQHGEDYAQAFASHLENGYVYSGPDALVLAHWIEPGTLFIWLAIGPHSLQRILLLAPPETVFLSWKRGIRGHTKTQKISFERFKTLWAAAKHQNLKLHLLPSLR